MDADETASSASLSVPGTPASLAPSSPHFLSSGTSSGLQDDADIDNINCFASPGYLLSPGWEMGPEAGPVASPLPLASPEPPSSALAPPGDDVSNGDDVSDGEISATR